MGGCLSCPSSVETSLLLCCAAPWEGLGETEPSGERKPSDQTVSPARPVVGEDLSSRSCLIPQILQPSLHVFQLGPVGSQARFPSG